MAEYDLGRYGATLTLDSSSFDEGLSRAEQNISGTENKTKSFAKGLGTMAAGAVAGLGVALVGAGVAGVKMADDLQGSLNTLQSATGATDDEMKGMEESLKNIYSAGYGESFSDIAQQMAIVKQNTGLAGTELEKATKNAMALGSTFDMDVTESTNAANSLMKQFGISSEEAFNLIAQGAQNGANKNGDLLDSLNEYAPQFQAMGFSAEEFTNVLIDGAKNGAFSIDKVGDAVKEFNIRAKDGSDTTNEAFSSLGLNADKMGQAFAQGGEKGQQAFQQVMTSLNNIEDPMEKNRIGVALFGTQYEDLEAKGVAALANIGNTASLSKDALGQINQLKFDTLGGALQGIWRSLQTALITPIQQHVLPLLSQFATWIQAHMPQIQATITTIFSAIGTVIGGFINVVKSIITTFQSTSTSTNTTFNSIKTTIQTIMTTIGQIIQTVLETIKFLWQTYGQTIVTFATNAWNNISTIISGALQVIQGVIKTVLSVLKGDWQGAWDGIKSILSGVLDVIKGTIDQVFNAISLIINTVLTTISTLFTNIWNGIKDLVKTVASTIYDYLKSKFEEAKSTISTILKAVQKVFSSIWDKIKSTVSDVVSDIYSSLKSKFEKAKSTISNILGAVEGVFSDIWSSIKSTVVDVSSSIYTSVKNKFDSMKSKISNIFNSVWSTTKNIFNKIKSAITNPVDKAVTTVKSLIGKIKDAFNFTWSLPKLKLPHVSVDMKKNSLGIPYPDFDISWYKTGAFFDKASIVGLGEKGREAIVPLENKRYMAPFADAVYQRLRDNMANQSVNNNSSSNTNNTQNFNVTNNLTFDVKQNLDDKEMKRISKYIHKQTYNGLKKMGSGTRI
jgi:TP901 family phage tail tape measure protein